jgi:hypothetical protein
MRLSAILRSRAGVFRHAERPTEFDLLNVTADQFASFLERSTNLHCAKNGTY